MIESVLMFIAIFSFVLCLSLALNHYGGGFEFIVRPFDPLDDGRKEWER